jgi:hypothetical protein
MDTSRERKGNSRAIKYDATTTIFHKSRTTEDEFQLNNEDWIQQTLDGVVLQKISGKKKLLIEQVQIEINEYNIQKENAFHEQSANENNEQQEQQHHQEDQKEVFLEETFDHFEFQPQDWIRLSTTSLYEGKDCTVLEAVLLLHQYIINSNTNKT